MKFKVEVVNQYTRKAFVEVVKISEPQRKSICYKRKGTDYVNIAAYRLINGFTLIVNNRSHHIEQQREI